jgi:CBS domain containing-hemolysin-like protein
VPSLESGASRIQVTSGNEFNVHGSVHGKNILIYIQKDASLHSLFYLETALHVSGGTITHHQKCKQLYLQHLLFVTPLLLSAAIVEELELV